MSTLLKLGLSGYDVKPRFCAFLCENLLQNPLFLWGKKFGGTRHLCEKYELTSIVLGRGCTVRSAGSKPNSIINDITLACFLLYNDTSMVYTHEFSTALPYLFMILNNKMIEMTISFFVNINKHK